MEYEDGVRKRFIQRNRSIQKQESCDFSIQNALIVLGVHAADIALDDCQKDIELIIGLSQQQPEFIKISEDRDVTDKRIYRYIHEMQDPARAEQIVDQAVRSIPSGMNHRVSDWMECICYEGGLTEATMKKLNEIEAKLKD